MSEVIIHSDHCPLPSAFSPPLAAPYFMSFTLCVHVIDMHPTKYLANRLRRTIRGPMWHGPAVGELLVSMTADQATTHGVAGAHSIWELVLHMAVWAEIATARLDGGAVELPPPETEWPTIPAIPDGEEWAAAKARLATAYETLAARVATLAPERLAESVPGQDHPMAAMLDGVIEHGTYHGGQIAILKRAMTARILAV